MPLPSEKIQAEAEILRTRIHQLDHEYFVLGRPSASDSEYDGLFEKLKSLEKEFPELAVADSPTKRVGSDLSSDFPEVRHSVPVLSLDKAYSVAEILTWVKRCSNGLGELHLAEESFDCVLEQKLDGLSLVLYYKGGLLDQAVTRGNGEVGNDVTANVRTIKDVPLRLARPIDGIFRGEVFLQKDDFEKLNTKEELPYANPRNLAGGTLRRAKSSEVAGVPLRMFVYEAFYDEAPESHWAILEDLKTLGFRVNPRTTRLSLPAELPELENAIKTETAGRKSLDYEIDGLVIKVDDATFREALGYTGHHPRWAVAYKFESPQGLSRVISIDVQVGRTGRITPVARVEPVLVGGTTIQNVTLHNQDYINALELAEGDTVSVSRRGDVIPAVESVVEKGEGLFWGMPDTCPSCGQTLVKEGAHHFCVNFDCPDRMKGRLYFFVARDQMDIDGLGPETIDFLVREGMVADLGDLFRIPYDRLREFPGFGDKKVENLTKSVETARARPFRIVLPSLGIPELGPKVTELLLGAGYRSMKVLFETVDSPDAAAALEAIKGIGPKTIERLKSEFSSPRFRALVKDLEGCGLNFEESADVATPASSRKDAATRDSSLDQIFQGQTWCVTGTFENFKPRSVAMDEILKRGGTESDSVTKETTHLLLGEGAGSKLEKARKLGTEVVTEAQFLALLGHSATETG